MAYTFPTDLMTNRDKVGERRLKVESLQSGSELGFELGRGFRFDYLLNLDNENSAQHFKFVIGSPIDLTLSDIALVEGGIHYEVFTSSQVTEDAPFTSISNRVFPLNSRVSSTSSVEVYNGSSFTVNDGEEANTNLFVRTASGGGNRAGAVGGEDSRRGFPATIVYARVSKLASANTDVVGTYKLEWYEL